ncbi:MAG: cellulose-binding protein [Cyanobacteria bacterium RI_101]|nr:cellulose-binding protein [Cyanobacteria bacterium RI_101]
MTVLSLTTRKIAQLEGDSEIAYFNYTVTRTGPADSAAAVQWRVRPRGANPVDGEDFVGGVLPEGTLTFAPNQTSRTIQIRVQGDSTWEPDETFRLDLFNPSAGAVLDSKKASATGTIQNDDSSAPALPPNILGTNLSSFRPYNPALPLVDAFKSARVWTTHTADIWNTKEPLNLDANGWVTSIPETGATYDRVTAEMYRSLEGRYPGGQYVVLYEGQGTIEYGGDAVKNVGASTPGRDVLTVAPSDQGIFLTITDTNPQNYLRNIRVVPLGAEPTYQAQPFNPDSLEKLAPFSTLRFMDWMETNNSAQQTWADRPTLTTASWMHKGAPVEIMVQLANTTQSHPWFTMPHQADDDYVRNFAAYVRDNLDPNLTVYVEYSNEVWNGMFGQYRWVRDQARAEWAGSGLNDFALVTDWYSRRTTQIAQIWDDVFGAEKERVIGVMAGQAANIKVLNRALSYAWTDNPLSHQDYGIDAIAIAPYMGNYLGNKKNEAIIKSWKSLPDKGLTKLFDELTQGGQVSNSPPGGALAQATANIVNHAALANAQGLELLAYEGGQHLVGFNPASTQLFRAANRDPRMGQLYEEYLQNWRDAGGGLFVNFTNVSTYGIYGSWGALEHVNDPSSPKYEALLNYRAQFGS